MAGRMIFAAFMLLFPVLSSAQFRNGAAYDDLYDGETVSALKSHVRELSAAHLEGRKAGSEGEKAAVKGYVLDTLAISEAVIAYVLDTV